MRWWTLGKTTISSNLPTAWFVKSPRSFLSEAIMQCFPTQWGQINSLILHRTTEWRSTFFSFYSQPNNNNVFRALLRSPGVILFDSQTVQTNRSLLKFDDTVKPGVDVQCSIKLSQFVWTNKRWWGSPNGWPALNLSMAISEPHKWTCSWQRDTVQRPSA